MRTIIRSVAVIGCVLFFVGVVLNLPRRSGTPKPQQRAGIAARQSGEIAADVPPDDASPEPTPAPPVAAAETRREATSRLRPTDAGVTFATPDEQSSEKSSENSSDGSSEKNKPAVASPAAAAASADASEPPNRTTATEQLSAVSLEADSNTAGRAPLTPGLDGDPTRQFRVPGQSPHLLLAVVEDLSREDLGCYGARWLKSPRMNEIAEQGLRHSRLAGSASGQGVERTALWFGELPPTPPEGKIQRLPRTSLPEMLWQAGFAPTLLGDCSWAGGGAGGQGGWHHSYGWDDQEDTKFATYPRTARRDGRLEPVMDNSEIEATRFERLLFDEAKRSLAEHEETHRPVALIVTLRLKWWRDAKYVNVAFEHENWTAAEKEHASAILAVDRLIGEISRQVEKSIGARRTIIAVVGLPREKPSPELARFAGASVEKEAALSGKQRWPYAPLLVRWPGRIQAGSVMTSFCGFQDLLPTFGEMVQARQAQREIHGVTQWREWCRSAGFPRGIELQPSPE